MAHGTKYVTKHDAADFRPKKLESGRIFATLTAFQTLALLPIAARLTLLIFFTEEKSLIFLVS